MRANWLAAESLFVFDFLMAQTKDRRHFLRTVPMATVAVLALPESPLHAAMAQGAAPETHSDFQLIAAQEVQNALQKQQAAPGSTILTTAKEPALSMTLTVEEGKTAAEFEFHEHRDHIFQILDGTTRYELGGIPKRARSTKPGEWLAPECEGFKVVTATKGDVLVIPRMTPHRRITEGKVSFTLITATTPA